MELHPVKEVPHMAGMTKCLRCDHRWVGVAPVGTDTLDCPKCGCHTGVYECVVEEKTIRACECGNVYFQIGLTRTYCARCGQTVMF